MSAALLPVATAATLFPAPLVCLLRREYAVARPGLRCRTESVLVYRRRLFVTVAAEAESRLEESGV